MAREWALVPAYGEALARVRGPGSLPGLVEEVEAAVSQMLSHGRGMFERWLDSALSS